MADVTRTPAEAVREGAARARAVREAAVAEGERLRAERAAESEKTQGGSGTTSAPAGP